MNTPSPYNTNPELSAMKEQTKLKLDEEMVQSKNYWGEGYREEVAEHGYSLQASSFHSAPPPKLGKTSPQCS